MVDIGNVIVFSFSWYKNREFFKYALMLWALSIVSLALLGFLVLYFFGSYGIIFMADPELFISHFSADLTSGAFFVKFFGFLLAYALLVLVEFFFVFYINALSTLFALRSKGFAHANFPFSRFFSLIGLGIVASFAALFYSFDEKIRKWHWLSLAGLSVSIVFLSLLGVSLVFALLGLLLLLACGLLYIYYVIVNSLRMSVSMAIFLQAEKGIIESLKESFGLTEGRLIEIFVCFFAVGLISGIVLSLFAIVAGTFFALALVPFVSQIAIPSWIIVLAEGAGISQQSVYWNIASYVGELITNVLFGPFVMLIGVFALIGIYSELLKDKSAASAPPASKPETGTASSQAVMKK